MSKFGKLELKYELPHTTVAVRRRKNDKNGKHKKVKLDHQV